MDTTYATRLCEQLDAEGRSSWYADHPALPGCHAVGATQDEALERLQEARDAWITVSEQLGDEVPEPSGADHILIQYAHREDVEVAKKVGGEFNDVEPIEVAVGRT